MLSEPEGVPVARLQVSERDGRYSLSQGREVVIRDGYLINVLEQMHRAVTQAFIGSRPDLLWFHAAAVGNDQGALMMPGNWGHGKSTLSVAMAGRGWAYLSDDLVPLDRSSAALLPFPAMPAVRRKQHSPIARDRLCEVPKDIVALPSDSLAHDRRPISSLVFPSYAGNGCTELTACPPASTVVELLRNCLNFSVHGGAAVSYLCRLLAPLQAYRLSYSDAEAACDLLENLNGP